MQQNIYQFPKFQFTTTDRNEFVNYVSKVTGNSEKTINDVLDGKLFTIGDFEMFVNSTSTNAPTSPLDVWVTVNGYVKCDEQSRYQVSQDGGYRKIVNGIVYYTDNRKNNIKSFRKVRVGKKTYKLHKLLAQAFLGADYQTTKVSFKDGDIANVNVFNLIVE